MKTPSPSALIPIHKLQITQHLAVSKFTTRTKSER
jgi:hypothetical protein